MICSQKRSITRKVVSENYRRTGVARTALAFAEDWLRERGYTAITAKVTDNNIPARHLMDKEGYTLVSTTPMSPEKRGFVYHHLIYRKTL